MRKFYLFTRYFFLLVALATCLNFALADGKKPVKTDTAKLAKVFSNKNDKSYLKTGIKIALPPLKPSVTIYGNNATTKSAPLRYEPDKVITNVQVFPNPITDQINLRYYVSRNTTVNIKIMDVLGNEVVTLFSQRVDPGEQKFTYNLNSNKLSSGFYFVRLVVGNESIIKRISIL